MGGDREGEKGRTELVAARCSIRALDSLRDCVEALACTALPSSATTSATPCGFAVHMFG